VLEDTVEKVQEPHLKDYLTVMLAQAREHEQKAEALFSLIGRSPLLSGPLLGRWWGKVMRFGQT
jgi:hypothetical protein